LGRLIVRALILPRVGRRFREFPEPCCLTFRAFIWPVDEVESLRPGLRDFSGITIDTGSRLALDIWGATQVPN